MSKPANLIVADEPDYLILVQFANGRTQRFERYGRNVWKRLSAIAHARYLAKYYPDATVRVLLNV